MDQLVGDDPKTSILQTSDRCQHSMQLPLQWKVPRNHPVTFSLCFRRPVLLQIISVIFSLESTYSKDFSGRIEESRRRWRTSTLAFHT
jgi:hypothetical protein